jgi:hypothetical protein
VTSQNVANIVTKLYGIAMLRAFNAFSDLSRFLPINCRTTICFMPVGAVASNKTSIENFVFSRRRTQRVYQPLLISAFVQPWSNGSPPSYSDALATQFAFGGDPNHDVSALSTRMICPYRQTGRVRPCLQI